MAMLVITRWYPIIEKFFTVSNLPQLLAPFGGTSRFSMIRRWEMDES